LAEIAEELQAKVKAAARVRVGPRPAPQAAVRRVRPVALADRLIAIGASTGGVEALKHVLMGLPAECPPILITQHMPPRFTTAFAERLNRECPMAVSEAVHNEPVEPNHAYVAAGSHHLELVRSGSGYRCSLSDGPTVSGHRPSVDVLFRSFARVAGHSAIGVILTGMGKDGAEGMREMREAGAITLGQDEASSLIYGMPRVAFERGGVMKQYSLSHIAEGILDACDAAKAHPHNTHLPHTAKAG
jgi:two-component system chemotaxis response regulator CheB